MPGIPSLGYGRSHNFWPPFFSTWDFLIYVPQKNMCTMDPKWIFFFLGPSFWHLAFGVTSTEALDDWPFCHSALQIFRNHTHEATAVWHLEVKRSRVWAAGKKWLIYCQNYTRMTARRPNRKRNSSKRGDTPKKKHVSRSFTIFGGCFFGGRWSSSLRHWTQITRALARFFCWGGSGAHEHGSTQPCDSCCKGTWTSFVGSNVSWMSFEPCLQVDIKWWFLLGILRWVPP